MNIIKNQTVKITRVRCGFLLGGKVFIDLARVFYFTISARPADKGVPRKNATQVAVTLRGAGSSSTLAEIYYLKAMTL